VEVYGMARYILKRLLLIIPIMFGVVVLVFVIIHLTPGDPARVILGSGAKDADLNLLRQKMGLNDPFFVQLGRYLYSVFIKFDFGTSYITNTSVTTELLLRFPRTLFLAVMSIGLSLLIGIPIGVNAAVHQNKAADYGSMAVALVGTAMPGFWLALVLVLLFSYKLDWLPAYGMGGFQYWIIPIVSNAFAGVATMARQMRSGMLEVINSDYIVMAKSKGLREKSVIYLHALPNALIPVITIGGMSFGTMLGGALITEVVFSIPGIGVYMVTGVNNRDYTVVQGGVIFLAVTFTVLMLLCDLLIAAVDPRVKAQITGGKRRGKNG
jgi:peptide/nickel transport system permease protein